MPLGICWEKQYLELHCTLPLYKEDLVLGAGLEEKDPSHGTPKNFCIHLWNSKRPSILHSFHTVLFSLQVKCCWKSSIVNQVLVSVNYPSMHQTQELEHKNVADKSGLNSQEQEEVAVMSCMYNTSF